MHTISGTIAVQAVQRIIADRLGGLERVIQGRADHMADPNIAKHAGRRKLIAGLLAQRSALGKLLAHRADPDAPPLTDVPAEQLGLLVALACGDQAQRRILRDLDPQGTALRLLEILESRPV